MGRDGTGILGRRYIINKRHQYKLIASFVGTALFAFVLSTFLIINDVYNQIESYIDSPRIDISKTGEIVLPVVLKASVTVTAVYLVLLVLMVAYYFYSTRRVIEGMDENFRRLGEGDLAFEFSLKDKNDFASLVREFNDMLSVNKERIEAAKASVAGLEDELDALEKAVLTGKPAQELMERVKGRLASLESGISGYRLG